MTKLSEEKKRKIDLSNEKDQARSKTADFWDFWGPIFVTIGLYAGIKYFIAEARYIPSGSMLPTLQINDRIVIEKLTYQKRSPRRREVVVFNSPYSFDKALLSRRSSPLPSSTKCALVNFPLISFLVGAVDPACHAYIKRVVAVAGDSVFVNSNGNLFVNDELIVEPYVTNFCSFTNESLSSCKSFSKIVPPKHVFVLGDNRANSWDGRFWPGRGFLPETEILGRAVWRFWPFRRIGSIDSSS